MVKSCLGISLNLEKSLLRALLVDPNGNHVQAERSLTSGTADLKLPDTGKAEVVLGLPNKAVHSRYLEFPPLRADALETAVRSAVMRYFPFQASRQQLVHAACPTLSGDRKRKGVVAYLIDLDILRSHTEFLKNANVKVDHVEFSSLAWSRWLCWERQDLRKGAYVWMHLEADSLHLGLIYNRLYYGCVSIDAPLLRLAEWQNPQAELSGLGPYLDFFATQVAGAVTHFGFRLSPNPLEIKGLVLQGIHQEDEALQRALAARLSCPLISLKPERLGLDPRLAVAAGLSLRNLGGA
ncbi:hypothetical protein JST97_21330 [bacterium]|nr:hypothetical protein [bacterium]